MKEIPLFPSGVAIVDSDKLPMLSKYKWYKDKKGRGIRYSTLYRYTRILDNMKKEAVGKLAKL